MERLEELAKGYQHVDVLAADLTTADGVDTVIARLTERPVDLVILGTHGRGGLDRLMIGSVAATVARKALCSVLVISPGAALAEGLSDAVTAQTMPAWHREPAHAD